MICKNCGKQLPDEAHFCGGCGAKEVGSEPDDTQDKTLEPIENDTNCFDEQDNNTEFAAAALPNDTANTTPPSKKTLGGAAALIKRIKEKFESLPLKGQIFVIIVIALLAVLLMLGIRQLVENIQNFDRSSSSKETHSSNSISAPYLLFSDTQNSPETEEFSPDEYAGYIDVAESDWYYDAIKFVSQNELMNGISASEFSPNLEMSRAMLVTVIHRLEGEPSVLGERTFADVASGQWYTDAIIWAAENEIVKGYGNNLFGRNDSITREQIAVILMRYTIWKDLESGERADISGFNDYANISEWALDAVQWANAEGLMTGRAEETLAPKGNATRAETAVLLQRLIAILD